MARQIVAGIVLLAFVNYLMGCSIASTEKVPGDVAAQGSETITELVLLDGKTVDCRPAGAKYRPARIGLQGGSATQLTRFIPLEGLVQCRITPPRFLTEADLDTARIAEAVLNNSLLVEFQSPGALFDKKTRKIQGRTLDGHIVSYVSGAVKSLRAERPATISVEELEQRPQQPVYEIVTSNNLILTADSSGWLLEHQPAMFVASDARGKVLEIPVSDVLYANVEKVDVAAGVLATIGIIVAVAGVILLIIIATKQSCPFVYSYDGHQYVFDAEPLGGAICRGLERSDISRLDFVKPVDGEYRLLVRNEVEETQFIDRMRLLTVDHPPQVHVYPDLEGTFYGFTTVMGATSAFDEKGMSLMDFLRASDNVTWQTHLPSACKDSAGPVRHRLTVTLPRPSGAKKAWLVTNIGTSAWGSNMIRKTVEYRGNTADEWLNSLTPGSPSYAEMNQFIDREEMYRLKTWVKEGESWQQEGLIHGQGPFVSEDRVYPIDVSGVKGDSIVLRFDPPKGFWTFDYIGVSYDEPVVLRPEVVEVQRAEGRHTPSILDSLRNRDGAYYVMPEVGDWATLRFIAPPTPDGAVRTVYLETGGYYELHLPKDKPDQLARLFTIGMIPGQIVKTLMEEFRSWQSEQQASRAVAPAR